MKTRTVRSMFPSLLKNYLHLGHPSIVSLVGASLLGLFPAYSMEAAPQQAKNPQPVGQTPLTSCDAPVGTWTLAILPDTQYYTRSYPDVYTRQTQWITKNREAHQILFVAHEGDVTANNVPEQWQMAHHAMKILNRAAIPYAILPGNHDLGRNGKTATRHTFMNDFFKEADYSNSEAYELFEKGKMENSCHTLSTPTGKFLIVALEFGPRDEVLEWANKMTAKYADHRVIVVTHAYLYNNDERNEWVKDKSDKRGRGNPWRYGFAQEGSVNDGEEMWKKFVSLHPNIVMVLNGHIARLGGTGYRVDIGKGGQKIHQILANYQDSGKPEVGTAPPGYGYGGGGYLRLMQFYPDGKTVKVKTYSPWYDHWLETPDNQFALEL